MTEPLDRESIMRAVEAMKQQTYEPSYPLMSDPVVDAYLERGIVPEFVAVSSQSADKIRKFIEDHSETD